LRGAHFQLEIVPDTTTDSNVFLQGTEEFPASFT
jgi:hypothetical protein